MTDAQIGQNGVAERRRATKRHSPPLTTCGGCDSRWSTLSTAHCGGCHRTFTGIVAFDTHRVGGRCRDPDTLLDGRGDPKLVRVDKLHWSGWGLPGADTRWWDSL